MEILETIKRTYRHFRPLKKVTQYFYCSKKSILKDNYKKYINLIFHNIIP